MTGTMSKSRLDQLVVERGLADSREKAQALILARKSGDEQLILRAEEALAVADEGGDAAGDE